MFERFTDRARKVMALANQEAQRFNHEYIGTEHILLGLVKEGSGVGASVLRRMGVDLRKVRLEVEKLVKSGPDVVTMGKSWRKGQAQWTFRMLPGCYVKGEDEIGEVKFSQAWQARELKKK